jgi:hypothetical protein
MGSVICIFSAALDQLDLPEEVQIGFVFRVSCFVGRLDVGFLVSGFGFRRGKRRNSRLSPNTEQTLSFRGWARRRKRIIRRHNQMDHLPHYHMQLHLGVYALTP